MKPSRKRPIRNKAASAALAFLALTPLGAGAENLLGTHAGPFREFPEQTVPELPREKAAFRTIERAYHFRQAETPRLIESFLEEFPASILAAEAKLMLANWYFFNGEYALALREYSSIPENAFSGNIREGMLYRKAFSQVKTGYYTEAARYFRMLETSKEYGESSQFYSAYIEYVKGNYDEAYRRFRNMTGRGVKATEAEFYLNQIDYRNGEYRTVANTSERLLSGAPVPEELLAETMRVGALSFFKLDDKTTARNMLERYIGLTGDGAEISAIYALATIYYDEGAYSKALPLFSIVTQYPGDLAQSAWLYMGQTYLTQGDPQAAAMAFDKASKESWNAEVAETAAYNLAVTSTAGMALPFSDAAAAMESFIDAYPASPYASSLSSYLANAYYGKRDYENALRQVDKIASPDAETTAMRQKILYQLGTTLLQQGDTGAAIRTLSDARTPDREVGAQAQLWLGDAYYTEKDYKAAVAAYENALGSGLLGENSALAQYNLGYAFMKLRNYPKAEAAFRKASTMEGLNPRQKSDARLRYADCLYYNGKFAQALTAFKDIKLDGGPDAVFAQIREADILGRDGRVGEKISILEALSSSPDAGIWRPTILSRLADAYSEKGDDKKAAELYAKMLDSSGKGSDNSQTYYSLATNAENLYKAGDRQAAYEAYKRLETSGISALYPSAVAGLMRTAAEPAEIAEYAARTAALPGIPPEEMNEALFIGAQAGLQLGGLQGRNAIGTLESLAQSSDRLWGAKAAVTLGEELLRQGDASGAEKVLLDLVDNGSDDNYWLARGYITLSDAYSAMDKAYLARLYLETLQSNYPGNEKDIRQMISTRLKALDK